jgi:FHS family L-fucose permease-like MFS transporter
VATSAPAAKPAASSSAIRGGTALVVLVVSLFFIWGGITSLNDVLIPKLKGLFQLSYAQAMLIQFAFFTAYAVVSLPAGGLVARLGYGRGIAVGLGIAAIGCLIFVPAAHTASYPLFLGALFILAGGITILQVAANPLIANLGLPATASSRLTFAQAFNSLGTTIAPYIGAHFILRSIATAPAAPAVEAAVIGHAYLGLCVALVVIAAVFWVVRHRLGEAETAATMKGTGALLRRPRLLFGAAAIFLYVGAEVTIGSIMTNYLMQSRSLALSAQAAGEHIAFYWGGAMVGRFIGGFVLRAISPGKVLAGVAVGAIALCLVSMNTAGALAGWSLIAVGLMNAIMFPTIFTLGLEGLGERTPQGSGILCVAIVGGALVPVLGGAVADAAGLALALIVPAVCYALIAAYGWSARNPADPLAVGN